MKTITKKILIAVKTYPVPSKKYIETVCTAGFDETGEWIRIYPIPFRLLYKGQQYKKYNWIECEIHKNPTGLTTGFQPLHTLKSSKEKNKKRVDRMNYLCV